MCRWTVRVWHSGCTRMPHCYTSYADNLRTYRFGKNSDEKKYLFLRTSIMWALKTLLENISHNIGLMPFKKQMLEHSHNIYSYRHVMYWSGAWCKKTVDDHTTLGFKIYYTKINNSFTTFIFYSYPLVVDWFVKANLYFHSKIHLRNCPS